MRETLRKKLTAGGIAAALVLGVGAIAGAATSGGSAPAAPASHEQGDDNSVSTTDPTTATPELTPTTLDDHGIDPADNEADDVGDDNGVDPADAPEGPEHEGVDHEADDAAEQQGGEHHDGADDSTADEDRSGSNSGPG